MQMTPLPGFSLRDLADVNEASQTRSPGLHVTDIVREILVKIDPERYSKSFPEGASENWQEAGFIWEELLSRLFALRASGRSGADIRFRPGEVEKDGIVGSPDGICVEEDGLTIVEEYKATWKSSRNFDLYDKRYLWWLLQLQAYCHMVGTRFARLYVLHINGNYDGYIPQTQGFLLEFTERELDEQWTSFKNTAKAKGWLA